MDNKITRTKSFRVYSVKSPVNLNCNMDHRTPVSACDFATCWDRISKCAPKGRLKSELMKMHAFSGLKSQYM